MKSDNTFLSFLKNSKGLWKPVLLLLAGALFLIFSSRLGGEPDKTAADSVDTLSAMEAEVAALCSSVRGVGRCVVMITFERGEETTYHGSSVASVSPPRVGAVSVVCDGGDSPTVQSNLTELLTSLFGIGANRVTVLKLSE